MWKWMFVTGLVFCSVCGFGLIKTKIAVAQYANCKVGLNALPTCTNTNTGNCPTICANTNTSSNGMEWSNATVYGHIAGTSLADTAVNADCWRNATCSSSYDGLKVCDPFNGQCLTGDNGFGCWTFSKALGNWVPASSAQIKVCPN